MQKTIARESQFSGIGLHSGDIVQVSMLPATTNTGIVFRRTDVLNRSQDIAASFNNVSNTSLCTTISNRDGVSVATIEHLMSALWACDIDNILITINGSEVPIMDGSAAPFVKLISETGVIRQNARRKVIKIKEHLRVSDGTQYIEIYPDDEFKIDFSINFAHRVIGEQNYTFVDDEILQRDRNSSAFVNEISCARTFGFKNDLEKLKKAGLALGASLDNSIGLDEKNILNEGGLRFQNEFVRHKILDCIGDFYLAGKIAGKVKAHCSGHSLNNAILYKLFSVPENYEVAC